MIIVCLQSCLHHNEEMKACKNYHFKDLLWAALAVPHINTGSLKWDNLMHLVALQHYNYYSVPPQPWPSSPLALMISQKYKVLGFDQQVPAHSSIGDTILFFILFLNFPMLNFWHHVWEVKKMQIYKEPFYYDHFFFTLM